MTLTAEQIKAMHGNGGYWCQGDAVFVKSQSEIDAIASYRLKMSQGAIGITSHLETLDAFRAKGAIEAKNLAYSERSKILLILCRLAIALEWTVGIGEDEFQSDEWRNVVFLDLPTEQVGFHIHISELPLFANLPPYEGIWKERGTDTKWQRLLSSENTPVTVHWIRDIGRVIGFYALGHIEKNRFWEAMSNEHGPRKEFDAANPDCVVHESWIIDSCPTFVTVFWF